MPGLLMAATPDVRRSNAAKQRGFTPRALTDCHLRRDGND